LCTSYFGTYSKLNNFVKKPIGLKTLKVLQFKLKILKIIKTIWHLSFQFYITYLFKLHVNWNLDKQEHKKLKCIIHKCFKDTPFSPRFPKISGRLCTVVGFILSAFRKFQRNCLRALYSKCFVRNRYDYNDEKLYDTSHTVRWYVRHTRFHFLSPSAHGRSERKSSFNKLYTIITL